MSEPDATGELVTPSASRSGVVRGRIRWADGNPAPNSEIHLRPLRHGKGRDADVRSDDAGWFSIRDVKPGIYRLIATVVRDRAHSFVTSIRVIVFGPDIDVELRFPPGGSIFGTVIDELGRPVPNALVVARAPIEEADWVSTTVNKDGTVESFLRRGDESISVHSEDDGSFRYEEMTRSSYTLSATAGVRASTESVNARPGEEAVRVVVNRQASFEGRVVRRDGKPLGEFVVGHHRVASPDGRFALRLDDVGSLPLVISASGLAPDIRPESPGEGETIALGDVVLGAGRTVRGFLRTTTNEPIVGAAVFFGPVGDTKDLNWGTWLLKNSAGLCMPTIRNPWERDPTATTTNAKGAFALEHVPESVVEVHAVVAPGLGLPQAPAPLPRRVDHVQVVLPPAQNRVELRMAPE